jgi:lipooligosaccharide transport system permease protein
VWRVIEANARVYKRVWRGSVASTFLIPLLYLAAMGMGLGTLVDDTGTGDLAGLRYIEFLAPGLMAAAAMQTGAGEGSFVVFAGIKWRRTYHAILSTPVTVPELVLGHLGWAGIRVLMTTGAFAIVSVVLGVLSPVQALAAILPATLTGVAFTAGVTAYSSNLDDDQGLPALFRFGIVPMFLFSGTFFPVSQLPDWIEPLAAVTPLWHGVELSRAWAFGTAPAWPVALHVGVLVLVLVVGTVLAFRTFATKLQP